MQEFLLSTSLPQHLVVRFLITAILTSVRYYFIVFLFASPWWLVIMEKGREFLKNIYFCFIDYAKAFDCVDHNKLWKIPASWEICMQVRKQQLELDMEQQTGSK